jgi:hypothetical protein
MRGVASKDKDLLRREGKEERKIERKKERKKEMFQVSLRAPI